MNRLHAEAAGHDAAIKLLNKLLTCETQAEGVPAISNFLEHLADIRGKQARKAAAGGVAVALVDILLAGIQAVKARGEQ